MATYIYDPNFIEVRVPAGMIATMSLIGSAGASAIDIQDNSDMMTLMPSLFASLDNGINYEPMSASFMKRLIESTVDMILRIDCTQLQDNSIYVISKIGSDKQLSINTSLDSSLNITLDGGITGNAELSIDHYSYDATQRCFNEADLHKVVNDNLLELGRLAQDNAGWPITYYKADLLSNVDVLNAYSLRAINGAKQVAVFFPHRKTIGQLDFDQFGLTYEELTNVHILADEFRRIYNDVFARPMKLDIIYIAFLNQFFELSDVQDVKSPTNELIYFDCTLRFLSDRQAVSKNDDILDLSDMTDGNDMEAVLELKQTEPDLMTYPEKTWSLQTFSIAEKRSISNTDNYIYGIAYFDDAWQRISVLNGKLITYDLSGNLLDTVNLIEPIDIYFAKMARFNAVLSSFDANVYYTTNVLTRTLKPLELIEHQVQQ